MQIKQQKVKFKKEGLFWRKDNIWKINWAWERCIKQQVSKHNLDLVNWSLLLSVDFIADMQTQLL